MINMHIGEIFETNNSGNCKILEYISGDVYNNIKVKIKFIDTGYEKIVGLKNVIKGNVKDNSLPDKKLIPIDYEKIYHCCNGPYKIIGEAPPNKKDGSRMVKVLFLNTNNIQDCRAYRAMRGQIKDQKLYDEEHSVIVNRIYNSNTCGKFKVIKQLDQRGPSGHKLSEIQFVNTGTKCIYTNCDILAGKVVDPYFPSVCKIGCLGKASSKCREYTIWHGMIRRCYDKNDKFYKYYGMIGVTVDKRWLCFENFINDFKYLPGYDDYIKNPLLYTLDKDILQSNIPKNKRVYSKYTCTLILRSDNTRIKILEQCENNNYIGVYKNSYNNYRASITVNGTKIHLGIFSNEIAAANAYNYASNFYSNGNIVMKNNVPYMPPQEFIKYNLNVKEVIRKVK